MIVYRNHFTSSTAHDGMLWDVKQRRWVDPADKPTGVKTMEKTVPQMTAEYNEHATAKGLKAVKKFKDRATATRRLAEILNGKAPPASSPKTAVEMTKAGNVSAESRDEMVKAFGFRSGSTREKLLLIFIENFESQVAKSKIKGLDVAGIEWMIGNKKLKFTIKTDVAEATAGKKKEKTYGLYRVHAK